MSHVPQPDARGNAPHPHTSTDDVRMRIAHDARMRMVAKMPRLMRAILEAQSQHMRFVDWGTITPTSLTRIGDDPFLRSFFFVVEVDAGSQLMGLTLALPRESEWKETLLNVQRTTDAWTAEFLAAVIGGWEAFGAPPYTLELLKSAVAIMADDERRDV